MNKKIPRNPRRPPNRRKPIGVLVALKSARLREAVGRFFEALPNFRVVGFTGGWEATVQMTLNPEVELVLMDIDLPPKNGLEATRRIKERPNPPVVILCALSDASQVKAAVKAAGADAYVAKVPNMAKALRAAVRRAFPGRRGGKG